MKPRLTSNGLAAQVRSLHGDGIVFSKIKMGNGDVPANYFNLSDLQNPLVEVGFSSYTVENGYIQLTGTFSNSGVNSAFYWTEVGIFIQDPDDEYSDILYAYGHCELEEEIEVATSIPMASTEIYEIQLTYNVYVGEAENLSAVLAESSIYATQSALDDHVNNVNNPHQTSAAQVGLGNVPNVTTDNQTPTVETASTLAAPANGDNLRTIVGKITKAIKDLIAHINDAVAHVSNADRTAWNNKANGTHNHSAADITSGTLAVGRGGTGKSTVTKGALLKGNGTNALVEITGNGALYADAGVEPTFGVVPIKFGGTGATTVKNAAEAILAEGCKKVNGDFVLGKGKKFGAYFQTFQEGEILDPLEVYALRWKEEHSDWYYSNFIKPCLDIAVGNAGNELVTVTRYVGTDAQTDIDDMLDGEDTTVGRRLYLMDSAGDMSVPGNICFQHNPQHYRGIWGYTGNNDGWRIVAGASSSGDDAWLEIATRDNGNEPIYVRQYATSSNPEYAHPSYGYDFGVCVVKRTATLLDGSGNTRFPGSCTATSHPTSSDRKIKNILGDLETEKAKTIIMGMQPVEFVLKDDVKNRKKMGFVAQDVYAHMQEIGESNSSLYQADMKYKEVNDMPETCLSDEKIKVTNDKKLDWTVDYQQLIAPLVKVIQDQERRIAQLEELIAGES